MNSIKIKNCILNMNGMFSEFKVSPSIFEPLKFKHKILSNLK